MAQRRANGEGCIYWSFRDNRWIGRYTVSKGKRKEVSGKTLREVREKLMPILRELETNKIKNALPSVER